MSATFSIDPFADVFARFGGRYETGDAFFERLLVRARERVRVARADPRNRPNLPFIEVGWVNEGTVNSRAALDPSGAAFIGLNYGMPLVLFDLFNRILGSRELFPRIGHALAETQQSPTFRALPDVTTIPDLETDESEFPRVQLRPLGQERRNYAVHLFLIAFDFIVLHEIQHVMGGHLGVMNAGGAVPILESRLVLEGDTPDIRQTFEMDADASAVVILMSGGGFRLPPWAECDPFEDAVYERTFAVLAAMRLWKFGTNAAHKDHPSPHTRRSMATKVIVSLAAVQFGEAKAAEVAQTTTDAMFACEFAFETLTGVPIPREEVRKVTSYEMAHWEMVIAQRWQDVLPEIRKHSLTTNIAKPSDFDAAALQLRSYKT